MSTYDASRWTGTVRSLFGQSVDQFNVGTRYGRLSAMKVVSVQLLRL
jgi:hypothetical protein